MVEYRRYSRVTVKEMVRGVGGSARQARRFIKYALENKLMRRCYDPTGKPIPDLYEIPESLDVIESWREQDHPGEYYEDG